MKNLVKSWLTLALTITACAATAQIWPERPVRLIVPYSAGAMGDSVARLLAEEMRSVLGQLLIVENRAGAGGNIGAATVARAAPDGQTWLVAATNNLVVNQYLYKKLDFDPLKAFEPATLLVSVPSVLFVHPSMGRTLNEASAVARVRKGKLNFGSPGSGTTPHLSMVAINQALDWQMMHVPYQGATAAVSALLAGDIHAYLGGAGLALSHVQAGKVHALAVASDRRLALLPDVPTFAESGLGALKASNWWALVAPRGTPTPVIERMVQAVQEVMKRPAVLERLDRLGVQVRTEGPRALSRQLEEEAQFWRRAVSDAGVSLD
jgi:tripartite-type tricarboxylate transporter receptor subunit TctC